MRRAPGPVRATHRRRTRSSSDGRHDLRSVATNTTRGDDAAACSLISAITRRASLIIERARSKCVKLCRRRGPMVRKLVLPPAAAAAPDAPPRAAPGSAHPEDLHARARPFGHGEEAPAPSAGRPCASRPDPLEPPGRAEARHQGCRPAPMAQAPELQPPPCRGRVRGHGAGLLPPAAPSTSTGPTGARGSDQHLVVARLHSDLIRPDATIPCMHVLGRRRWPPRRPAPAAVIPGSTIGPSPPRTV